MTKKKKKHQLSKSEFIFNFVSLVSVIAVGIYFGYRSLYYYSKQNMDMKAEANTLNGFITSNEAVADGDGLHHDEDGFYFKGNLVNNYVLFANRVFRVIRVNKNNSVKLISQDNVAEFMWGEDSSYKKSNLRNWLTTTDNNFSGVYYNTLPKKILSKTVWQEDVLDGTKVQKNEKSFKDFIAIPSIYDYTLAGGKDSYFNNGSSYSLLGYNENDENLYVDEEGYVQTSNNLEGYGVRAVITLKANLKVSAGDGSINNPYIVDIGNEKNFINKYVKLGNDMWIVFKDDSGLLKMLLSNSEIFKNYGNRESFFDLGDDDNIAYYLNTTYFNSLSYNKFLIDNYYYTGEISDDAGYNFSNIYSNFIVCKVGLLNIFDYNPLAILDDYFYMTTRANTGGMQYIGRSSGFLEEADVKESKKIIPVITIESKNIIKGSGTFDDPYTLE